MGDKTSPTDVGTPGATAPEQLVTVSRDGGLVLLADPLRHWPPELVAQLQERRALTVLEPDPTLEGPPPSEAVLDGLGPNDRLVLGYADPRTSLATVLECDRQPDVPALVAAWLSRAGRMLELRQRLGRQVHLINLSRLDAAAQAALLELLAPESPLRSGDSGDPDADLERDTPTTPAVAEPAPIAVSPLPAVVRYYLAQRPEIDHLLADLAACAEVLGREPERPPAAPTERGLVLAERLLHDWLAQRDAHRQELERLERELELRQGELTTTSGVLADVAGLQRQAEDEAETLRRLLAEAQQQLIDASQQVSEARQQLSEARQQVSEEEARQRDGEEERELILLQLKQVQDELSHTFEERNQAQQRSEELAGRLAELEEECRTLFLHSRLSPQIDRNKITTILRLMRETLSV